MRPASAHAFASKLFVLQHLNSTLIVGNTTVQNLNTVAELSSLVDEPPDSSTKWTARSGELDEGPPSEPPTLRVDAPPTTRRDGPRSVPTPTLIDQRSLGTKNQPGRPAGPEIGQGIPNRMSATGQPRSFAEAERAAAQARSVAIRPVLPPMVSSAPIGSESVDGTSHSVARQPVQALPPSRSSRPSRVLAIVVATAIPAVVIAAFVIFFLTRRTSRAPSGQAAPPSTSAAPATAADTSAAIPLLPPDDPVPPPASPSSSAASSPSPTASAAHRPHR